MNGLRRISAGSAHRHFAVLVMTLALSGCGAPEALPVPGADGLVVMHWWDEKKAMSPAYMQAERLVQSDAEFKKMEFTAVMMRLPGEHGVVYVIAPQATYERGAANEIQLGPLTDRPVDGPVRFFGTWNGDLFMGRAAQAVFEEATHRMRLDQVEICASGLRQRADWVAITQEQAVPFGQLTRLSDAPALTAAMAALPSPLVFPPIRNE